MSAALSTISLATATPGGGFPLYGQALAATVRAADPTLLIEPRHTRGSTENVPLLRGRQVDLALVQGEVLQAEVFSAPPGPDRPLILWAMYGSPGLFALRGDAPQRSIADLRGQRIAWGARGSGLVLLARAVMGSLGLDLERDFEAVFLDRAGDGPAMVLDGRAAALWGAGTGWPGFTAIAGGPAGARFIAPSPEEAARIVARHAFLRPMSVPAGGYPGLTAPVSSVGSWSFVMARADLSEGVAWRLARALHLGEARFAAALDQAGESTARNTATAPPDPALLHPGVRRYLAEAVGR
ncbi:MAG: TAXI family TRAP transporter solute-binding subunit [Acetobacteraceae bacterium]|nr:TAXI family TRAP transporter solute-binding subunit [Acetobacteraceae bacterium]